MEKKTETQAAEKKTVVIVPAYNEAKAIGNTLEELKKHVSRQDILVVDDGSSDGTGKIAEKCQVKVVSHFANRGYGAAVKTGLDYAAKNMSADIMVTFDADGQHFPEDIEKVAGPIAEGEADVVIGSRFLSVESDIPFRRVVFNRIANIVTGLFFGLYVSDSQSGLRALGKEAAGKMKTKCNTFEFCSEMIAEIRQNNLKLKEVPIRVRYSEYSLSKGQSFLKGISTLYYLFLKKIS